ILRGIGAAEEAKDSCSASDKMPDYFHPGKLQILRFAQKDWAENVALAARTGLFSLFLSFSSSCYWRVPHRSRACCRRQPWRKTKTAPGKPGLVSVPAESRSPAQEEAESGRSRCRSASVHWDRRGRSASTRSDRVPLADCRLHQLSVRRANHPQRPRLTAALPRFPQAGRA